MIDPDLIGFTIARVVLLLPAARGVDLRARPKPGGGDRRLTSAVPELPAPAPVRRAKKAATERNSPAAAVMEQTPACGSELSRHP